VTLKLPRAELSRKIESCSAHTFFLQWVTKGIR